MSLRDLSFSQRFCEDSGLQGCDAVPQGEWFPEFKDRTASTRIHITQGVVDKGKKVKFTLEQATKAQRGSRFIALLFL